MSDISTSQEVVPQNLHALYCLSLLPKKLYLKIYMPCIACLFFPRNCTSKFTCPVLLVSSSQEIVPQNLHALYCLSLLPKKLYLKLYMPCIACLFFPRNCTSKFTCPVLLVSSFLAIGQCNTLFYISCVNVKRSYLLVGVISKTSCVGRGWG